MKQNKKECVEEILGVEEYLAKRKRLRKEEIKKDQDKYPDPFLAYSSFLLLSL